MLDMDKRECHRQFQYTFAVLKFDCEYEHKEGYSKSGNRE